jgi:micrococcal nuclease
MRQIRLGKRRVSLLALLIALFLLIGQHYGWFDRLNNYVEVSQPGQYQVVHFVDGDTIVVSMNGRDETIRFIGVDTPETHKPNTPVQCYGPAAAAFTKNTIGDQRVRLSLDPDSSNRDRYNRLLRYVYLPDGTLLNKKLIETGNGFYYPYFPFTKSGEFERAQASAQAAHRGVWGNCKPIPTDRGGYTSPPAE